MTTQASTPALDYLRRHVSERGMPQTPQGWFSLVEQALAIEPPPDPQRPALEEVARRARYAYDQWVQGDLTRKNGMEALQQALDGAGY